MHNKKQQTFLMYFFCLLVLCFYPSLSLAAVAVQTEVVSGNIIEKLEGDAIKLDNGEVYHPSRTGLVVNIEIGAPTTLRYSLENDGENVFYEFAPGLHSLPNAQLPVSEKDNSPK